ncbi:MAG: hypothetical protein HZB44_07920 [Actinobacteria bacterium]|nr:hypothetical protein [Actinomycetota bacterium]
MEHYEAWLSDLVLAWRRVAKEYDSISNLFDLSMPTQIYACHMPESDDISKLSIVILHDPEVPDLLVKTVGFSDKNELAERVDSIENDFGIVGETTVKLKLDHKLKIPVNGLMTRASLALNDNAKAKRRELQSPIELYRQMALSERGPTAATWVSRVSLPLPDRDEVVQFIRGHFNLENEKADQQSPAVTADAPMKQVTEPSEVERQCGYATYPHPHIYWGDPDVPLPSDRINGIWMPKVDLVCRCEGDEFAAWVFSNGRIVTSLCEAPASLKLANLFFSIIARSGIETHEVAEDELIYIDNLDETSGRDSGSSWSHTPRNIFQGPIDLRSSHSNMSFIINPMVAKAVLEMAIDDYGDSDKSEVALRLLSSFTLYWRAHYSEAFVAAWSLIERWIVARFKEYWTMKGMSRNKVQDKLVPWHANTEIDLLEAAGVIDEGTACKIHEMRQIRNKIVHDLMIPKKEQCEEALITAETLSGLPRIDVGTVHQYLGP